MPSRSQWSHILDNNERRKAQNRVAQRNYRTRQRRRLEAAETILDMTTQISPATGQSFLGLLNTSGFDNFSSGDCLFPEIAPQNHSVFDTNTSDCQFTALSPRSGERCLNDCEADNFSAYAQSEFGNEGTIQTLSPTNLERVAATPLTSKSPDTTSMSHPSPNTITSRKARVSTSEESDQEDDGCSPLLAATLRSNTKMVKLLATKGADLEKVDKHGRSALMIAVEKDDSGLVQTLLSLGADIRVVDRSGQDPFQKAAAHVNVTMLRTLLEWCREASEKSLDQSMLKHCVNKRDNRGKTLIHTAALQGRLEVVELLLEYGADVNATSR